MLFANDILAAVIIGGTFLIILALAEMWSRKFDAQPENTRKFVHLAGGMLCLTFPWTIRSPWVVLGLALLNCAVIITGRKLNLLQSLHKVNRKTAGSEYYPISIFLVFLVTYGEPWLYLSSVLVLAVADAFAALIGGRYGYIKYSVENDDKSLEGSLAFLVIAFLAICLPMLFLTDMPMATCFLASLLVAILVTGFEAISLKGTDNLFVPLAVAIILAKITSKPVSEIMYQIISLTIITGLITLLIMRVHSFNVGGSIVFLLFAYGAWSLGSEFWALPVLIGFSAYMALWAFFPGPENFKTNVRVVTVFHALIPAILLLIIGNIYKIDGFMYGPFLAAIIVIATFSLWNHIVDFSNLLPKRGRSFAALLTGITAFLLMAIAPWIIYRDTTSAAHLGALFICTAPMAVINDINKRKIDDPSIIWNSRRILLSALAAVLMITLQLTGIIPCWYHSP